MNDVCKMYVNHLVTSYPDIKGRVLEVGSYDINGNVNDIFNDRDRFSEHIHVDACNGDNVDHVMYADDLRYKNNSFDCVLFLESMEHDPTPWLSMREFCRILKPSGHVIITTCGYGFPMHMQGMDYWRFSIEGLERLFEHGKFTNIKVCEHSTSHQLLAIAQKPSDKKDTWWKRKKRN